MTQKIIDAGGNLNDIPNEDLAAAGIDSTCHVSNNGYELHEHHEWPGYPVPEHENRERERERERISLVHLASIGL